MNWPTAMVISVAIVCLFATLWLTLWLAGTTRPKDQVEDPGE